MHRSIYLFTLFLLAACEPEDWSKPGNLVPLTADQDASVPSQHINGTLLHVESYGTPTDPLIVVIHGGPGGDFRSLLNAKVLADDGFHVVFYDQRGTGLSKREDRSQFEGKGAVDLFIADLDELITLFRFGPGQKVFLMGHSWGAMLATAYINKYPERITGAVLAEPGGLTWPQTKGYLSRSNEVKLFSEAINNALVPEAIMAGKSHDEILDYKASFFSSYENAPGNAIGNASEYPFWRNGAVSSEAMNEHADKYGFDFTGNLDNYDTKVLFLYSERNTAYGESWAEQVSAPYPSVDLQMVKNSGHEMLYFGWSDMYPKALNYFNQLK
jgi:proline iminopeptidase